LQKCHSQAANKIYGIFGKYFSRFAAKISGFFLDAWVKKKYHFSVSNMGCLVKAVPETIIIQKGSKHL